MVGLDHGRFFGGSDSGVSSCGMLPCGAGGGGQSSSSFLLFNAHAVVCLESGLWGEVSRGRG